MSRPTEPVKDAPGKKGEAPPPLSSLGQSDRTDSSKAPPADSPAEAEAYARERPGDFKKALPWVILVSTMFLLTYLDRAMFGPLLSSLEKEFSISHAISTRFLFFMSVGYSVSMFLSGFSSSKIRPRVLVSSSIVCCGLVLLGISAATSTAMLSLLFVMLGVAAAQYFNGGLSTMRSLVKPVEWSNAISVHEIGPNASFFIGPILAEVGGALLGWRGVVAFMGWLRIAAGHVFYFIATGGD